MAEKHVGYACPECGSDMLTHDDFIVGMRMQAALSGMEALGLVQRHVPGDPVPDNMHAMRMHYHDGKMTVKVQQKTDD